MQKVNGLGSSYAYEDRLGSVGKYLPYGEDKPGASGNPANDNEKFATYTRDANTGIDYADQRWHAQGTGRFLTADPYQASAGPGDPGSWNRYGYVDGDPANFRDPSGLLKSICEDDPGYPDCVNAYSTVNPVIGMIYSFRSENTIGYAWTAWFQSTIQQSTGGGAGVSVPFSYNPLATIGKLKKRLGEVLSKNQACRDIFNPKAAGYSNVYDMANSLFDILTGGGSLAGSQLVLSFEFRKAGSGLAEVKKGLGSVSVSISLTYWYSHDTASDEFRDGNLATLIHEMGHVADLLWGNSASSMATPDVVNFNDYLSGLNAYNVDQSCFGGKLGVLKP